MAKPTKSRPQNKSPKPAKPFTHFPLFLHTMRLVSIHNAANRKTGTSHLIREAYRDNGNTQHRTIANLSRCWDDEIETVRLALKHTGNLANLGSVQQGENVSC